MTKRTAIAIGATQWQCSVISGCRLIRKQLDSVYVLINFLNALPLHKTIETGAQIKSNFNGFLKRENSLETASKASLRYIESLSLR